jgi:hypothetical protein
LIQKLEEDLPTIQTPLIAGMSEGCSLYGSNIELTANMIILVPNHRMDLHDPPEPRMIDNEGFEKPILEIPARKFFGLIAQVAKSPPGSAGEVLELSSCFALACRETRN